MPKDLWGWIWLPFTAGDMPFSYRLMEIISSNVIPIIISLDYTPPFSHLLNWTSFSWIIDSPSFSKNPSILKNKLDDLYSKWKIRDNETLESLNLMKSHLWNAYNRCFKDLDSQLSCLLDPAYGRRLFHLRYCPNAPPLPSSNSAYDESVPIQTRVSLRLV